MQLRNARTYRRQTQNTLQIRTECGIEVFHSALLSTNTLIGKSCWAAYVTVELRHAQYPYLRYEALDYSETQTHGLTSRRKIPGRYIDILVTSINNSRYSA